MKCHIVVALFLAMSLAASASAQSPATRPQRTFGQFVETLDAKGRLPEPITPLPDGAKPSWMWKRSPTSVALLNHDRIIWQLVWDEPQSKPYFHPIATARGEVLTWCKPTTDHPWHRAMWWSCKLINGVNYWEEKNGLSDGRTIASNVRVTANPDGSARIEMDVAYRPPPGRTAATAPAAEEPVALSEKRHIAISAPDAAGNYRIDWTAVFTAGDAAALLQGDYYGLAIRAAPGFIGKWRFINSDGQSGKAVHSRPARWVAYQGQTPAGAEAGLATFDHPDNPRHPTGWYAAERMPYFSAAPGMKGAMTIKARESQTLKFRVLVQGGPWDAAALRKEWEDFAGQPAPKGP